ncbi:MAG: YciI family protein [Balneolaceae bacterium]|nr:YciI family protein [Balneolaceae bacterium]
MNTLKNMMLAGLAWLMISPMYAQSAEESAGTPVPETFRMQWNDSTVTMQKYFVVFLKAGPTRNHTKEEAEKIQQQHLDYLSEVYLQGHTSIAGPFAGDGEIRGIVIYNTATVDQARALAEQDPAVQAGRLTVEVHPWWAAKGSKLK